jgi:hypothetical protein
MPYFVFIWTDEIIAHLAENDIGPEDFEDIVQHPEATAISRSSGRPIAFGRVADGRFIACVFELIDEVTVIPFTAYELS